MKARILATGLSFFVIQFSFGQGALTPPGAPGPVMKSLAQIEPRTPVSSIPFSITNAGSYYLTTNLIATNAQNGVSILTNNVTLDLSGFTVAGPAGASGIVVDNPVTNVTVRNGAVSGWTYGVLTHNAAEQGILLERLTVSGAGTIGIYCFGSVTVRECRVIGNNYGIFPGYGGEFSNCEISGNSAYGIYDPNIGTVLASDCMVQSNGATGIYVSSGLVRNCNANGNGGGGIYAGIGTQVQDCVANFNVGWGIQLGNECGAFHCTANNNTGNGILASDDNKISDCVLDFNHDSGVGGFNGTGDFALHIFGCTFIQNTTNGAVVGAYSEVRDNFFNGNGKGILVATNSFGIGRVRIEGNHITAGNVGIQVASSGNFIVRNTVSGSGVNYVINSNNAVGPIVIPPNSAAINGSTGGAGVGSTDPSANFSF